MTDNRPHEREQDPETLQESRQEKRVAVPEEQTHPEGDDNVNVTGKDKSHKDHQKRGKDRYQEKIAELEGVNAEMTDRHLRLQAEFDNFRKRTLKEKAELIKSGGESVLTAILPVVDDFDRALANMKDIPDDDPAKVGFVLIFNKFNDFLKQRRISEIEALGQTFNVDRHFAVSKIAVADEKMKGKIVDVIEKGYLLNDKVIRFAKVIIGE